MRLGNDPARGRGSVSQNGVLSSAVLARTPDFASKGDTVTEIGGARIPRTNPPSAQKCGKQEYKKNEQWNSTRFDPLYLFCCSAMWHKHSQPSAGWELVAALKSLDTSSHLLATSFLAATENAKFSSRDLRQRTRSSPRRGLFVLGQPQSLNEVDMRSSQALQVTENCAQCKLRKTNWFCGFSPDLLKSFSAISRLASYPGGMALFHEGARPRGAFVICSGRVKLSTTSREGKVLILKVAGPGEILGLSAVISGTAYETTAETVGPCQINFVDKENLARMIESNTEMSLRSIRFLSIEFQSVYRDIHELVLARSSAGKLARLLLSWTRPESERTDREAHVPESLTHEEMAQMIGASRETVTRLLGNLKKKELIHIEGSTLIIRDRPALELMAA
jgi:CRP/FNR family transcriptional regulator, cyclic AMP receptor protein